MGGGSGTQTDVERSSLLTQATAWEQQSEAMGSISTEITGSEITGVDAGYFADGVSVYNQVCTEVGTWCSQGQAQMLAIAGALCTAARKYGATEEEIIKATHGAIH